MRVRVIFRLKNKGAVLPFHHQNLLSETLTSLMANAGLPDSQFYNFSGLKGQTKVGRNGLHYFSKRVTLVFASLDERFCRSLVMEMLEREEVCFGELRLQPEYAEEELQPEIDSFSKYLCISPLVLVDTDNVLRNKEFVYPTLHQFSDRLFESTRKRMLASGLYGDSALEQDFKFHLIPDKQYLDKVDREDKKFARIYAVSNGLDHKEVRGYTLPFALHASKDVHAFAFNCGLGEFCPSGFGMLDLAHTDPNKRTVPFRTHE